MPAWLLAAKRFLILPGMVLLMLGSTLSQTATLEADLQKSVEQQVTISENKNIFILFCLLNVGGYNEENNSAGMHPVRIRVRQRLSQSVPPDLAMLVRRFYRQHAQATPYEYSVVALSTGGAPDFKFNAEWPEVSKDASFGSLSELPPLLRQFYGSVPIEDIYASVRSDYLAYIEQYRQVVIAQVIKVMAYCRTRELSNVGGGEVTHAVVIPNLLESFSNAFSFVLDNSLYSVEGPQAKIGYNPHEFVHSVTNRISYDPQYRSLQQSAQPLYELATSRPDVADLKTLQNFLDENLVRAISLRYLNNTDPARAERLHNALMSEYRQGYTLEPFFYEQLGEYEKGKDSLAGFYPTMLKRLNVGREMTRWKQDGPK